MLCVARTIIDVIVKKCCDAEIFQKQSLKSVFITKGSHVAIAVRYTNNFIEICSKIHCFTTQQKE